MSKKIIAQIALWFAILSWLALVMVELTIRFSAGSQVEPGFDEYLPNSIYLFYVLALFVFYKARVPVADRVNLIDLLWKVFITGLLTLMVAMGFRSLEFLLGGTGLSKNVIYINFIFMVVLGLASAFAVATFVVWKRLILYQKSKRLLIVWNTLEYLLLGSLLLDIVELPAKGYYQILVLVVGVMVAFNMKWVAYLSFKQKWKSIALLTVSLLFLVLFASVILAYQQQNAFLSHFTNSVFLESIIGFATLYALFSVLVIAFNIPTTSAFEQKLNEVINFQRISQSIQTEKNEEQIFKVLLDSAVQTVEATAAWIELEKDEKYFFHEITYEQIHEITTDFSQAGVGFRKKIQKNKHKKTGVFGKIRVAGFRSVAYFPIFINEQQEGTLYLLKDVRDGFTRELLEIIETFTNQAGISVANFRMVNEAIATERYKEELKIAKQVQTKLLPAQLGSNPGFDIGSFSAAADEVGGDYYDSFAINGHTTALIIGDVSGKGTSAAFHMAQLKGAFLALAQQNPAPVEFLNKANIAISAGLDKSSFVTLSYFVINTSAQTLQFARAGHVPTLYYSSRQNKASYFQNKGLGLGIIRGARYTSYVEQNQVTYHTGDVLVLYTDGITEAQNNRKEEFGFDRLQQLLEQHHNLNPEQIKDKIMEAVYAFCEHRQLEDDYTLLVIKFK